MYHFPPSEPVPGAEQLLHPEAQWRGAELWFWTWWILQCLLTLSLGELIVDCSLDCIKLATYAPRILFQYFLWRIRVVIEAFITKRGLRGIVGTPKTLVECTVYLQCRFLEVIVISHKVFACSEVLIVFTCSCDCTFSTCVFFLIWSVWKDRTDTQFLFLPSFRKCDVLCNFATSEMNLYLYVYKVI